MGWNSYDCYSYSVTEKEVKANADYMAKHLKQFGWNYVVVDYVWSAPSTPSLGAPNQSDTFQPSLEMDSFGRLLPDPGRFPSSAKRAGFGPLADYCHSKGLKFGIHLMRGIPRQAVALKTPVLGTGWQAGDAADTNSKCDWLNHMYGMNMQNPAAQSYLNSLFVQYAAWGVDFVKVDDMSAPYHKDEIFGYRIAIQRCKRPIILSLSPGPTPLADAIDVAATANMWRLVGDLWDNWKQVTEAMDIVAKWSDYRRPGHWPDIDMLPLGKLRKRGPETGPPNTMSRLTPDEAQTLMTLECINQCPLMFGGDLPETDAATLELMTNKEVMDLDQNGHGGHLDREENGVGTWLGGRTNRKTNIPRTSSMWRSSIEMTRPLPSTAPAGRRSATCGLIRTLQCGIEDRHSRTRFDFAIRDHKVTPHQARTRICSVHNPRHMPERPSWDSYFMQIANLVKTRATCPRLSVGAVLVRDRRILATGYNGAPRGMEHCPEGGPQHDWPTGCMRAGHCIRSLHAEQNALLQAAYIGVSCADSTMYVTNQPCNACAKMIVNAGVMCVIYEGEYPDEFAKQIFRESGLKVFRYRDDRLEDVVVGA